MTVASRRRGARRWLCALICASGAARASAAPPEAVAALEEGDAQYERRADGARGGLAAPAPIEAALGAYRRALAADPHGLEACYKLLRALFFRASFCPATEDERKRLLDEGRRLGQQAVDGLERQARAARPSERIAALGEVRFAGQVYFWTAACWGQWALLRGRLAAARAGAASRIRDLAATVLELDPLLEQGGGDRLLGRLHHQAPKIPLLTGWVSRSMALAHLRRALERGPLNTVNQLFLAEALLDIDPSGREEARRLLQQCATAPPRPEYRVEDAYYAEAAGRLLASLR